MVIVLIPLQVKVPVKQGVVVGEQHKLPSGLQYESFLGVPYAQPPLGELRFRVNGLLSLYNLRFLTDCFTFKSPVPLERFDKQELDCTKEGDVSHQRDPFNNEAVGSENCLFLNVYVPKGNSKKSLPVMVWIHGGGFRFGSSSREK